MRAEIADKASAMITSAIYAGFLPAMFGSGLMASQWGYRSTCDIMSVVSAIAFVTEVILLFCSYIFAAPIKEIEFSQDAD